MSFRILISLIMVAGSITACSKKSTSPAVATTTTNSGYEYRNNSCYRISDNVIVEYSQCNNSSGYYLGNGNCYDRNNSIVEYSRCDYSNNLNNNNRYYTNNSLCYDRYNGNSIVNQSYCGTIGSESCRGLHLWIDNYGQSWDVNCDGRAYNGNCSGYFLYEYSTGRYGTCR